MYRDLHEAWRKEREASAVQKLTKDFYTKLAEYVKGIREESRMLDKKSVKGSLLEKEYENVKRMVKELIRLRYRKTLREALTGAMVPKEFLTQEEAKLHGEIFPAAEAYQDFVEEILRGHVSEMKQAIERKMMVVRSLKDIPDIVGSDMKTYGPFQSEDVASLPVDNARALLNQGVAVEVEGT